jgi:hypothetical protein
MKSIIWALTGFAFGLACLAWATQTLPTKYASQDYTMQGVILYAYNSASNLAIPVETDSSGALYINNSI